MRAKCAIFRMTVNGVFAGFLTESDVLSDLEAYALNESGRAVWGYLPNGDQVHYELV
jgi:hypothetical protein